MLSYGVVGWCEGVVYLTSLGFQLILAYSWARPAILVAGKGRGGMFLFLLFLHFHSYSSFFPVSLFYLLYCLFYLFSPFSGRRHKMTHKGWCVVNPQHNQSICCHTLLMSTHNICFYGKIRKYQYCLGKTWSLSGAKLIVYFYWLTISTLDWFSRY